MTEPLKPNDSFRQVADWGFASLSEAKRVRAQLSAKSDVQLKDFIEFNETKNPLVSMAKAILSERKAACGATKL